MVGWPGSMHDARVLSKSQLYRKVVSKEILNTNSRNINGRDVLPFLLGDSPYPLNVWLMKPFPHNSALSSTEQTFNYRLSRACIVVENAFGHLKARWQRLMKQNDMDISHVPQVVTTCCILHNLCVVHGEAFNDTWLKDPQLGQPHSPTPSSVPTSQARAVRDTLVEYFRTHSLHNIYDHMYACMTYTCTIYLELQYYTFKKFVLLVIKLTNKCTCCMSMSCREECH